MANLYKIEQDVNRGYDTYSDAVVVADSEEDAKKIHPGMYSGYSAVERVWEEQDYAWAEKPEQVTAVLVGTAVPELTPGTVVCASFHAG